MPHAYPVVIIGGGVMGSACAYFLKARLGFAGEVLIVEPDPTYRTAASARSASSVRLQFSTPGNIALSRFGFAFLKDAARPAAEGGLGVDVGLHESSYLFLATAAGVPALEAALEVQRAAGVPASLHDADALRARYPWLSVADLAAGADCERGEGWFDGPALLSGLRAQAQAHGARYVRDRVLALERDGAEGLKVWLASADSLACRFAVLAAGTGARAIAGTLDIDLPVEARKRNVFVFTCHEKLVPGPLVSDPSGLWFRPERDRFLCGLPSEPDPAVDTEDFEVDLEEFERRYWPLLAHRVPAFEAVRRVSAWSGHYDYNTFDQNAFVGPVPGVPALLLANGFSGHGIQQAPAVGRALAEWIVCGEYRALDVSAFSYARYLARRPLRELQVI